MGAVVLENIACSSADDSFHEFAVDIGLGISRAASPLNKVIVEKISEGCRYSVDPHISGAEVDTSRNGAVDSAQVDDQLAVHIEPEVIVSGELEDDVMAPVVQSVRGLGEAGLGLHGKIVIRLYTVVINRIQILIFPRITVREQPLVRGLVKGIDILGVQ